MLGIIWLFSVYIKPLENISEIESLRQDGIQLDIRSCTVGEESKPCVRIMKDQCNYSKIMIYVSLTPNNKNISYAKGNSYLFSIVREEKKLMPLIEYYGMLFEWHDQKWN